MPNDFGRFLDHTLLRPTGTIADVRQLCAEAMEHGMAAVCVFPSYVAQARDFLKDSRVRVATVIAFPFGVTFTEIKEAELRAAATSRFQGFQGVRALDAGGSRALTP